MDRQANSDIKNFGKEETLDNSIFLNKDVVNSCQTPLRIIFDTLLLNKKVTQQALADYVGIDKGNMSKICHGHYEPILRIKLKIAEFFEVDSRLIWRKEK